MMDSTVPLVVATATAAGEKIMAQMAALDMGRVRMIPMTTDTMMPMNRGYMVVVEAMKIPRKYMT